LEHIVSNMTDPDLQNKCKARLVEIQKSACCRELAIARNHLIAHPNRETLLRRDDMSRADFPNLTIPALEEMLRQVTALAGRALGKGDSEFWFHDWVGVSQLFDRLGQTGAKSAPG
jgi:hypothetical protein